MTSARHSSAGRTVTLAVLGLLLVTVCATVYVFLAQQQGPAPALGVITAEEEAEQAAAQARRLATLLTILLVSALLILLYMLGAYLVIRVGQAVSHPPVGGRPTRYVDVWSDYRLTEEEISAATREEEDGGGQSPHGGASPASDGPSPEE